MQVKVSTLEDIAKLPWAGNFTDDQPLGDLVTEYIANEPDLVKRQRACELVNLHMCGEVVEVVGTDEDPALYC